MARLHSILIAGMLAAGLLHAQTIPTKWVGTWAAAPESSNGGVRYYEQETVREIVHLSVGGSAIRVRLSNQFGQKEIHIAGAHIALRSAELGTKIAPGSDRTLMFNRQKSVVIPAGAVMWSDPVELKVPALSDVDVSLYFAGPVPGTTVHQGALQTNYEVKGGDFTSALDLVTAGEVIKLRSYLFLSGVDVANGNASGSIVTLGDSITDGYNSHEDTNHRWPNFLANRLHESGKEIGVLNTGISANRLLHDGPEGGRFAPGPNVLARFDADVLVQTGVTYVIVLEGINDLGHPGQSAPSTEAVNAEEMIGAFRQLIERAHTHRIKIYGCTILPFEGTLYPGFYNPAKEAERQTVNDWMRSSKEFDAVFDFDKALRDPQHPSRLLPAYDSGDHLHPSDAGHQAMAEAVDISLF